MFEQESLEGALKTRLNRRRWLIGVVATAGAMSAALAV